MKKLMAMLLSVALISTTVPQRTDASFITDFLGGIFTILSAPIWVFCQDNEFFRKQNPFRKKAWQELEEKENQILETDRRIESAISRIATRTVVEPSREPIVVAADIDYDKIIRLVLKAMPKPERPEEIDYDKLVTLVLKAMPKPERPEEIDYKKIEMEMGKKINEATKKMDNKIEEIVGKKVSVPGVRTTMETAREEQKCSRPDYFMLFCIFTVIVAAHIGAYFFGPTNLLRPICAILFLGECAIFIEILGLAVN